MASSVRQVKKDTVVPRYVMHRKVWDLQKAYEQCFRDAYEGVLWDLGRRAYHALRGNWLWGKKRSQQLTERIDKLQSAKDILPALNTKSAELLKQASSESLNVQDITKLRELMVRARKAINIIERKIC